MAEIYHGLYGLDYEDLNEKPVELIDIRTKQRFIGRTALAVHIAEGQPLQDIHRVGQALSDFTIEIPEENKPPATIYDSWVIDDYIRFGKWAAELVENEGQEFTTGVLQRGNWLGLNPPVSRFKRKTRFRTITNYYDVIGYIPKVRPGQHEAFNTEGEKTRARYSKEELLEWGVNHFDEHHELASKSLLYELSPLGESPSIMAIKYYFITKTAYDQAVMQRWLELRGPQALEEIEKQKELEHQQIKKEILDAGVEYYNHFGVMPSGPKIAILGPLGLFPTISSIRKYFSDKLSNYHKEIAEAVAESGKIEDPKLDFERIEEALAAEAARKRTIAIQAREERKLRTAAARRERHAQRLSEKRRLRTREKKQKLAKEKQEILEFGVDYLRHNGQLATREKIRELAPQGKAPTDKKIIKHFGSFTGWHSEVRKIYEQSMERQKVLDLGVKYLRKHGQLMSQTDAESLSSQGKAVSPAQIASIFGSFDKWQDKVEKISALLSEKQPTEEQLREKAQEFQGLYQRGEIPAKLVASIKNGRDLIFKFEKYQVVKHLLPREGNENLVRLSISGLTTKAFIEAVQQHNDTISLEQIAEAAFELSTVTI